MAAPATEPKPSAGDVDALWRTHHRAIRAHVRRMVPAADVDDVVQETFLSAWKAAASLDPTRDPAPWLTTIARNRAIDRLRRQGARPVPTGDDALLANLPTTENADPAERLIHRRWSRVVDAVRQLPDPQRRYVVLHHLDGFSLTEIADGDGTSIDTVKTQLYRARRSLRAALDQLTIWPAVQMARMRRLVTTSRSDATSAATAGTMVATALTGLLAILPAEPFPSAGRPAITSGSIPVSVLGSPTDLPARMERHPIAAAQDWRDPSQPAGDDGAPTRYPIARIDAEIPNPKTGEPQRRPFRVWLEDDGNDSVIISSAETANDAACNTGVEPCTRPIDWFKG